MKRKLSWRKILVGVIVLILGGLGGSAVWFRSRYATAAVMNIPIREFTNAEYPEDPAGRSSHYDRYTGRTLKLIRKDATHFDFVLEPSSDHIAQVAFRDVDVSLMTPSEPAWTKNEAGLERIALTDRQWNRQQVSFDPRSSHVEITGGNGWEKANLSSAELAKNCLNAGLWEILLFAQENGQKVIYYHGWFTFPLGYYKDVFECNTGLSYWRHWYKLEHWSDPAGTPVHLEGLRTVNRESDVPSGCFDPNEPVIMAGEQTKKQKIMDCQNILSWGDFFDGRQIHFASFVPPGRYDVKKPWKNQFTNMARFEKAIWREISSPARSQPLHELELVFRHKEKEQQCRFIVSGVDLETLPQLPVDKYPQGLYMPMGIAVPPFYQSYLELAKNPPDKSPYFSVLLDPDNRWLNHHEVAIDGPVLHRDAKDAALLHVYLLSYERHSLVGHFIIPTGARGLNASAEPRRTKQRDGLFLEEAVSPEKPKRARF